MQTLLAKLTPETVGNEDAVEAHTKVEEGEQLLAKIADALKTVEGADPDDAKAYVTSIKPVIAKVKKLSAKGVKKQRSGKKG